NYKGQAKTVTFEQLNSSPLTSSGSPTATIVRCDYGCFLFVVEVRTKTRKTADTPDGSQAASLPVRPQVAYNSSITRKSSMKVLIRKTYSRRVGKRPFGEYRLQIGF
ncbi:MAG: hypothetical protein ACI4NG_00740, partial [Candidatus Gallimonas sp.]